MAEHPAEVEKITEGADALLLNLGNIADSRMTSMRLSAAVAAEKNIPIVLDAVGVGCSRLRLDFAAELIEDYRPVIVKGNRSEIAALYGCDLTSRGVDVEEEHLGDVAETILQARSLSQKIDATVVASGPVDVAARKSKAFVCENGDPIMGRVCGTGCMLGALTALYATLGDPLQASLLALSIEGIGGEQAARDAGPGMFLPNLMDAVNAMTPERWKSCVRISEVRS